MASNEESEKLQDRRRRGLSVAAQANEQARLDRRAKEGEVTIIPPQSGSFGPGSTFLDLIEDNPLAKAAALKALSDRRFGNPIPGQREAAISILNQFAAARKQAREAGKTRRGPSRVGGSVAISDVAGEVLSRAKKQREAAERRREGDRDFDQRLNQRARLAAQKRKELLDALSILGRQGAFSETEVVNDEQIFDSAGAAQKVPVRRTTERNNPDVFVELVRQFLGGF